MALTVGAVVHEQYTIVAVLGEGATSTVYKVTDRHGLTLAMKAFEPRSGAPADVQEARRQFEHEVDLLRQLRHPSIPHVHDAFNQGEEYYFVMDLIEGRTLEAIVDHNGAAPESYLLPVATRLAQVLSWLHQHPRGPIVFRDVKPSNVMVADTGRVHLIDFGAARIWKVGQATDTVPLGTPGFAAPEQYGRTQSSPRTDLYGWGATVYRSLTGVDPETSTLDRTPLRVLAPACSPEMEEILLRCLRTDPRERFDNAEALVDALEALQKRRYPAHDVPSKKPTVNVPARVASTLLFILGAMFFLSVVVSPFARIIRSRPQSEAAGCKSNLKNISTALEMYAEDHKGAFPQSLSQLTPKYLKAMPCCPSAASVTYEPGYAAAQNPPRYTVVCSGFHHPNVGYSQNYPQYSSEQSLLER